MNLSSGEKQPNMHNTYFDEGIQQEMVFPLNYHILKLREQQKGLKQVLTERELWPDRRLKLEKARKIMSQQSDFLAQKS